MVDLNWNNGKKFLCNLTVQFKMYFLAPLLLRVFRQKFVLLCPVGHLRSCQYYSGFIILSDGHISTSQQYISVCIGTTVHRILNHCFSLLTYAWLNHNFQTYLWSQLYMTSFKNKQQCICLYKMKAWLLKRHFFTNN